MGAVGNKENITDLFVYDHEVSNGCKFYRGHTSGLWTKHQTLTSMGCSWWYIPWTERDENSASNFGSCCLEDRLMEHIIFMYILYLFITVN